MARLDTGWHNNPKVLATGVDGMALHAWSISYCDAARTDGFIPEDAWPVLLRKGVKVLTDAKLWEPCQGGYRLHDYTDYNKTRAEIETANAAVTARVTRYRHRKNGVTNGVTNADVTPPVTPTRAHKPGPGPGLITAGLPVGRSGGGVGEPSELPAEVLERLKQPPIADRPADRPA